MKKIKSLILIGFLLLLFTGELFAQSTVPFVNLVTTANSGTKVFQARSLITFGPGFSYTPNGGTLTAQIVDPIVTANVSYNTSQSDPLNRILNATLKPATLPGSTDISQVGSAGYSIPIDLPKGVDGFQPSISVRYSSMAGDGIMGKGWNIVGLGTITRVPANLYDDGLVEGINFTQNRFALNGQRLYFYAKGSNYSEYRFENDQSIKIIYQSDRFLVKTADGVTYEYGFTSDSKVKGDNTNTLSWYVNKITNNFGQVINVSYIQSSGYAYPALINYGASTVEFYYNNRTLPRVSYLNGNTYNLPYILDKVQVWNNGTTVRKYSFKYFKTNDTESPLLAEIGYSGLNNELLNSTLFKYTLNQQVVFYQMIYDETHSYISYKSKLVSGEFNGDGKTDLLCIPNPDFGGTGTVWRFYHSNGDSTFSYGFQSNPGVNYADLKDITPIDLNADGKDDIVYEKANGADSYFYYILNTGTTFASPVLFHTAISSQTTGFSGKLRRLQKLDDKHILNLSDFNGDGINDIFINTTGGAWKVYSMTNLSSMSQISYGTQSNLSELILVADFNGDGKSDIWSFEDSGLKVYSYSPYSLSLLYDGSLITKNHKFAMGDFNGDGKRDLMVYGYNNNGTYEDYTQWRICLSNGVGFTLYDVAQLKSNMYADYLRVADFNGDGATDLMVTSLDNSWTGSKYFMCKDNGSAFTTVTLPYYPAASHGYCMGDYDGDGRTDYICTDGEYPWWNGYQLYSPQGSNQDLLSEVSNGLGHFTKITYLPLSKKSTPTVYTKGANAVFPLLTYQGPLNVVSKVETNNGIGGTFTTSYTYEGAKIHLRGKGFLGFSKVTVKNGATGIVTENNYTVNSTHFYPQLTNSVVKHATNGSIRTVVNNWAEKSVFGGSRFIPYISSSTTTNNLTGFSTTTTTSAPDDYGNITYQSVAYSNGLTHSKTIVYNNDAKNWLIARPCSVTTTMSKPGDSDIVQLVTTTYNTGKVKPFVVQYFDGATQKKKLRYNYNSDGTLSAFHQLSSGLTETHSYYTYDTNGINLTSKTDPSGVTTNYTYYQASGLVNTITDHWNNTVSYSYDNFGNVSGVSQTNGIGISSQIMAWVSSPTYARYSVTKTMTDGSQSVVYYDILGREIRSSTKLFNGSMSNIQTDYNAKGQAYRVSEPFASSATLWNTTTFDNFGRVVTVTPSVGASSTYTYSGGTTTVSSNGRTYTTVTNSATGWPTSKSDPGGTINYTYKADGNAKEITAPGNVSTTMTYDKYGNQLTFNDPSAGNNSYTYYGGGEPKTQTTPLGTITYNYGSEGRIANYITPDGTYSYSYDDYKLLANISSPGGVSRSYTYYPNGKVDEISETIEAGQVNKVKFVYDCLGRDSLKTYTNANNVSFTESYFYNNYGYLDQIKFNGILVYDVNSMNIRGNITGASIRGTTASWGYDSYGTLTGNSAYNTMGFSYTFNATTGNLTSRTNTQRSLTENFGYDNLDRLDYVQKSGVTTLNLVYDSKGNIISKSDAGTLLYDNGKPYQLAHVSPFTSGFPNAYQSISYTSFGKVNTISEANYSATFKYNADNERIKMVINQSGVPKTKYYFGSSYEKVVEGSTITEYIWIGGSPYTAPAVAKIVNGGTPQLWAIFRDHLGSITHLKKGSTIYEYSFDAYGRRRDKDNWSYTLSGEPVLFANRGFTGHEHLTEFGLINMNGRLYDPLVGRFLSPDNYVQSPDFTQSFNRYAYCWNNPLRYTDPDGEWVHIVIGAAIGGVINLATNWNNCDGFWEYAAAFGAGAGSGALTAAFGPLGALGGGALVGGTNDLISQTGKNFSGSVNWGQVGISTGIGGVAGIAGYGAGQWASSNLGGVVINGFNINSQSVWAHTINGAIGGAAGGYAGGFTGGLLMSGDMSMAHQAGMQGMKFGAGIGAGTGFAGGLYSAKRDGLNPWTGKPKNSFTIGEGMITDPTKGWMGVDKIADDLGSDYYKPDSDIPMNGPFNGSTTSNGMYDNAIWIENNVKGTGAYIYDRGPVGNNSQYYNMEVGRTMNYPVMRVTPYYNRSQSIRVLIIRK